MAGRYHIVVKHSRRNRLRVLMQKKCRFRIQSMSTSDGFRGSSSMPRHKIRCDWFALLLFAIPSAIAIATVLAVDENIQADLASRIR